jgi:hypothetical protein
MKWFGVLALAGLLGLATPVAGYDGPTPLTYDETLNSIRVTFTSQGKLLRLGRSLFTMTAHVPVSADSVGQPVTLDVWKVNAAGDQLVNTCTYTPGSSDVGTTVVYTCDGFAVVPMPAGTTSVVLYPRVLRGTVNVGSELEHNGSAAGLTVPVVGDDTREPNNSTLVATNLGEVPGAISLPELVWLNVDYFKFTVPAGMGTAEVRLQFWNEAVDLDLYIYSANGDLLAASQGVEDEERAYFAATPGVTYYIDIEAYDASPGFYDLFVSVAPPDTISISSGPSGVVNPVASSGTTGIVLEAIDSLGHPLTYSWSAQCPSLPSAGTFSSRYVQTPDWTAPVNLTGAQKSCTLRVEIADNQGVSVQASYVQRVNPLADQVTITAGPLAQPNPVDSGSHVTLTVTASDTYSHPLTYQWQAACPGLPSAGAFSPSAAAQNPSWAAPVNFTGAQQTCSITVTASDGLGQSTSSAITQLVNPAPHTVTFTVNPTPGTGTLASGGTTTLTAQAADSYGHAVSYAWSATCAGLTGPGAFTPSAAMQSPNWTAPANLTGVEQSCALSVTASDDQGMSASASTTVKVAAAPHTLTITGGPTTSANPLASSGTAGLSASAIDSYGHTLTYVWSASCPTLAGAGAFVPNAAGPSPSWTAPANLTGAQQLCTLALTVTDGQGQSANASLEQGVNSVPDAITVTGPATGSPNPVLSEAIVTVGVVGVDSLGHTLTHAWSAACPALPASGAFANAALAQTTWTAPRNATGVPQTCALTVNISDGRGQTASSTHVQTVEAAPHTVTFSGAPTSSSNPVVSGGQTTLGAAAVDSYGHAVTYQWAASCPGLAASGAFAPGPNAQEPVWTAPANLTGSAKVCSLAITASDGQGVSAQATITQTVNAAPDVVTITTPPSGTPNPVPSAAAVQMSVQATDSYGHALNHLWQATCSGLPSNGSFSASGAQAPVWTAPINRTGATQSCAISVTINDGQGHTAAGSFTQQVLSVADAITITSAAGGSPNPVGSQATASLSVAAEDSIIGHVLTYSWTAACPSLPSGGAFLPGPNVQNPTWTAPRNTSGTTQPCSLVVTVVDGHGKSATSSYTQQVAAAPHTLTFSQPPASVTNPVASGASTSLTVAAVDSYDHTPAYQWQATCDGLTGAGAFAPSATAQNPVWTAPVNRTGAPRPCTLAVTASDGTGLTVTGQVAQTVNVAPHVVTITAGPLASVNPVLSGGQATFTVTASDSYDHALGYQWQASCPGLPNAGTFSPASAVQSPTWTAPENTTASQQSCAITVSVSDGLGQSATETFVQRVEPTVHVMTLIAEPAGTPNPVVSGGTVALSVSASDSRGHALTYAWEVSCAGLPPGTLAPGAGVQNPSWTAPANFTGLPVTCSFSVTASDGQGLSVSGAFVQTVAAAPDVITITAGPTAAPGTTTSSGIVALEVTASDSYGHALSYEWSAACPGLPANGSLSSPSASATTWMAPVNQTGTSRACTLEVRITDGRGQVKSGVVSVSVTSVANNISISEGPSGAPNPVAPEGIVAFSVVASDIYGSLLTYAWNASCPGLASPGVFDNPASRTPIWTAPANPSALAASCEVSVAISDGADTRTSASVSQIVNAGRQCTYQLTPVAAAMPVESTTASVLVTTQDGCAWSATSAETWLTVTGPPGGVGTGTVFYSTAPNTGPVPRTGTLAIAGQTVTVDQAGAGYTYYFAEGATIGGFFETRLALLNLDATATATVTIDFQLKDTTTVLTYLLQLPAQQRATIDVSTLGTVNPALAALASAEFSTVVRSDVPLVADRTMTWDATSYGSHAETAIDAPASTWYLAEGATIGTFELYYLIQNPNAVPLTDEIEVTYLLPPPQAPLVRTYSMGANTRRNIVVHAEPGLENAEVSAIIRTPADKPVIVERAMYLTAGGYFYGAGHESAGIRTPATQWFFAEGATGEFFDLFILIGNPNAVGVQVTATFLFDDGTTCSTRVGSGYENGELVVGARSRYNIWVDATTVPGCPRSLANAAVSTTITTNLPVVAERSMWWPGPTAANWAEVHNAPGATTTGTKWALADGEQGGARSTETYLLIANTSPYDGTARVTLYFDDGTAPVTRDFLLTANSRTNVPVGAPEANGGFGPAVAHRKFGAVVESLPVAGQAGPAQIVVERAMYSNGPGAPFWAAGTDLLATRVQ